MKKFVLLTFNMIFIIILSACSIESASTHDNRIESEAESLQKSQEETNINITLTVDCSNVIGKSNLSTTATIPSDGIWLNSKTITLPSGSTVYDALSYAKALGYITSFTEDNSILNGYIISINNLNQKECGKYSGWMYKVNGTALPVGAKGAVLNNNDAIVWFYTTSTT